MPGKFNDGFTKSAQRQKFVRNRDLKLKDKELKKEANIQKLMCEGVCRRCREKVQWRFNYNKYKPLKNPATCQHCKQKTVVKAYRTLCDNCAKQRNVCPGCCLNPEENARLDEEENAAKKPSGATAAMNDVDMDDAEEDEDDKEEVADDNEDDNEDEMNEDNIELSEKEAEIESRIDHAIDQLDESFGKSETRWDERKFLNIAASKYSKSRQING